MRTEEKVHLFTGMEFGSAFNVGVQVLEFSAGLTHDDFLGEITFVMCEDAETGVSPDFAVLHSRVGMHAAHTGDGIRIVHEVLEAEAHQRGGLRDDGDQGQADQEKYPEKSAAIFVTHECSLLFIESPALRKQRFCRDWRFARKEFALQAARWTESGW